jgi:ElaB/YqjD/DUF883 family membrane-anchored ribosome-binding protein
MGAVKGMARKSKAKVAEQAKEQVNKRTDDLIDDDGDDFDVDFDDNGLLTRIETTGDKNQAARRRLEDYLEEKRLRMELGDDFDY